MIIRRHFWELLFLITPLLFMQSAYFAYIVYGCLAICVMQTVGRRVLISKMLKDMALMYKLLLVAKEKIDAGLPDKNNRGSASPPDS